MTGWFEIAEREVTPARAASVVLLASATVLGAALLSQYLGGLKPCVLCIYQRIPYVATIGLGGVALAAGRARRNRPPIVLTRWILLGCSLAFVLGAGIAVYHVGVEQKWWFGTDACAATSGLKALTVDELREQILRTPIARCDQVAWSMFGVSMAGYNVLVSIILAALSAWMAWALGGRKELVNRSQHTIGTG